MNPIFWIVIACVVFSVGTAYALFNLNRSKKKSPKPFYKLAEISATLAGFSILGCGIFFSNAMTLLSVYGEKTEAYGMSILYASGFFIVALMLSIFSICVWYYGYEREKL